MATKPGLIGDLDVVGFRQSSVVTLAAHGVLDADQVAAAFRFRNAFEIVIDAKRQSIGFNEWQSPGPVAPDIAARRADATRDLGRARALLGSHGYMLVGKICGEGFHLHDLYPKRRDRDTHTDMLRVHLTSLAKLWRV
jgi:hypothetical protein